MKTISNKKVKDACSHIIQNHAFFASMMLQQNIIEDNSESNPTFYVDGENLAYNSSFADSLNFDEVVGVLVHEIFHLTLGHHFRKGERDNKLWNEACDFVVNFELIKSGFKLPSGLLYDSKYQGMSAEEVYRLLDIKDKKEQEKNGGKKKDFWGCIGHRISQSDGFYLNLSFISRHCERSVAIQEAKASLYNAWIATLRSQ